MDFDLWRDMLSETVWWEKFTNNTAYAVYQRTVVVWGHGEKYYAHGPGGEQVELTELYEQCKMVSVLKNGITEHETPWGG